MTRRRCFLCGRSASNDEQFVPLPTDLDRALGWPSERSVCLECLRKTATYAKTAPLRELMRIWDIDAGDDKLDMSIDHGVSPADAEMVKSVLSTPTPATFAEVLAGDDLGFELEVLSVAIDVVLNVFEGRQRWLGDDQMEKLCQVVFEKLMLRRGLPLLRQRIGVAA